MQTLFKSIERGSVILPLYPQYQIPCLIEDEISPYLTISGALDRLMFTYSAHPENLNNQLETEIEDPVARLGVLKSIQKISNIDTTIEIKTSASQPKSGHRFPQTKDKNITALINKFKENGSQTIQGIIFGFSGEPGNYYFIIRTKN